MRPPIRIHPQALRVDKSGDALDRWRDLLRRLYLVALNIDRADPKDVFLWEVMDFQEGDQDGLIEGR